MTVGTTGPGPEVGIAAVDRMAGRLTVPFARGADRLALTLNPGATDAEAAVAAYYFAEHRARFDADPDPRYVVTALRDVTAATTLTVGYEVPGAAGATPRQGIAELQVPAGTLAGMSMVLRLGTDGADDGPATRLRSLTMDPPPPGGTPPAALRWGVTALLGNLAKLLWVLGWERDALRAYLAQVRTQRRLDQAVGQTLDLFGFDLGVPRFPPLPYSFDDRTVALWHLDEGPGVQVQDAMRLFGGSGHPSTQVTARAGAAGRFGSGFAFLDPAAEITVDHHSDFALAAGDDFTAECFVKPDDGDWDGAVLSKHADPADPAQPGWALSVGSFGRGIPRNVRLLVSDGPQPVELFADATLPLARFAHLAGVIDRAAGQARLYVDGTLRATKPLTGVGALGNSAPVRIGRAAPDPAHPDPARFFHGVIDEVRLSRAARSSFHPVLGEDDGSYRRRLGIFRRWTLPTPASIQAALNEAVGEIQGVADPLVVDDQDPTVIDGAQSVTVVPVEVAPGESIDDLGHRGSAEADVNGTPAQDEGFDTDLLAMIDPTDTRVEVLAGPAGTLTPGGPVADPRRLRVGTRRALRALLDLLAAEGVAGKLRVLSGFAPDAPDLRVVGRALVLWHPALPTGQLAVLAHRAGFSWVQHRPGSAEDPSGTAEGVVYASVRSSATVEVAVVAGAAGDTATPEHGFDLLAGQTLTLAVQPDLPAGALPRWSTIACGNGRAAFVGDTHAAEQSRVTIAASPTRPGDLIVEVQVTRGTRSFTASRRLRAGIGELAAGQSIDSSGAIGVPEPAGTADEPFHPAYLRSVVDSRLSFAAAAGVNGRRMQPVAAARLEAMLDLLPAGPPNPGLPELAGAWNPAGSGTETVGRALTLTRGSAIVTLERLGALAHAAGFSYVGNDGNRLRLVQAPGPVVTIATTDELLPEGGTARLSVALRANPCGAALAGGSLWTANSGTDTASVLDTATGQVRAAVKVGLRPVAVAARPDGARVFTADRGGGTITMIDAASRTVAATIAVPGVPVALGFPMLTAGSVASQRLYVALVTGSTGQVVEIDTRAAAPTVGRSVSLGERPVALAVQVDGARLWVATEASALHQINVSAASFAAGPTVALAGPPADVVATLTRAYVTVPSAHALQVLDITGAGPTVQRTFTDLGATPGRLSLHVDPAEVYVYVTDSQGQRVYLRRGDGSAQGQGTSTLPASASVAGPPTGVVVADARHAYVLVGGEAAGSVSALDAGAQAALWPLGTGLGERLVWSPLPGGAAQVQLSSTTAADLDLIAEVAGPVLVRAVYQSPGGPSPYTFQVGLSKALMDLEQAGTKVVIRKDQYDLLMNVLNALHPVGVEVSTRTVREHVVELAGSLLDVFPGYTFPDFRARGPRPPAGSIGQD